MKLSEKRFGASWKMDLFVSFAFLQMKLVRMFLCNVRIVEIHPYILFRSSLFYNISHSPIHSRIRVSSQTKSYYCRFVGQICCIQNTKLKGILKILPYNHYDQKHWFSKTQYFNKHEFHFVLMKWMNGFGISCSTW